jgi:malyl-CoA/(S)-citramalyl-CoA lyase
MRSPRDFFRPLALGAPEPVRDIPVRPSRMIHFFDPSNPRMVEKAPDIASKVDILLGNMEDAVATENKEAAREGFIQIARDNEFGNTQLWTRINSLDIVNENHRVNSRFPKRHVEGCGRLAR